MTVERPSHISRTNSERLFRIAQISEVGAFLGKPLSFATPTSTMEFYGGRD